MTSAREQLKRILEDPEYLKNCNIEQTLKLFKAINPYSKTIGGSSRWTSFTYTPIRDRYLAQIKMISIVGFMYRMHTEYMALFGLEATGREMLPSEKRGWEKKKAAVKEFLDRIFEYDPENHVASSFFEVKGDSKRPNIRGNANVEIKSAKSSESEGPVEYPAAMRLSGDYVDTFCPVPPLDTFKRWQRYEEGNYERILKMQGTLYAEKPDFESALQIHSHHDSKEKADQFGSANIEQYDLPINIIQDGHWYFLSNYKGNREAIQFPAEGNEIIKGMHESAKRDEKTGSNLMKKRVERKFRDNVVQQGLHSDDLATYIDNAGITGKRVLTDEERRNIVKSILEKKVEEKKMDPRDVYENVDADGTPLDAINVDVLVNDGKENLTKKRIYVEADGATDDGKQGPTVTATADGKARHTAKTTKDSDGE